MNAAPTRPFQTADQIVPIQFLRAFAALAVAVFHYAFEVKRAGLHDGLPTLYFGWAGVDVFFVISGFVMVCASQSLFGHAHAPREFFLRRVERIVPLYWLVTSAYLVMHLVMTGSQKGYSPAIALSSYFFIPFESAPGLVEPLVGQGWTLNYEMFFYAVFAISLFAPKRVAVAATAVALTGLVVIGHVLSPIPLPWAFWTSDIVMEFVFGMVLGLLYCEGLRVTKVVGWLLIAVGCALLIAPLLARFTDLRSIYTGLPALCIVAGASLPGFAPDRVRWRYLILLGDASYALYLTHSVANRGVLSLAHRFNLDLAAAGWLYLFAAIVGSIVLAIALHVMFERPVAAGLKRVLARRQKVNADPPIRRIASTESP